MNERHRSSGTVVNIRNTRIPINLNLFDVLRADASLYQKAPPSASFNQRQSKFIDEFDAT